MEYSVSAGLKAHPYGPSDKVTLFDDGSQILWSSLYNWNNILSSGLHIGDLFDMLLPMLTIYQEYVRNHHYSLQVLTECKQSQPFAQLLARLESKSACQSRSLETFLTYPMHQVTNGLHCRR